MENKSETVVFEDFIRIKGNGENKKLSTDQAINRALEIITENVNGSGIAVDKSYNYQEIKTGGTWYKPIKERHKVTELKITISEVIKS